MNKNYIAILLCISQDIFISLKIVYLHPPSSSISSNFKEHSSTSRFTGMFSGTPGLGIDTVPNLGGLSVIKTSPSKTLLFSVLPFSSRLLESSRETVDLLLLSKLKAFRSSSNARCL